MLPRSGGATMLPTVPDTHPTGPPVLRGERVALRTAVGSDVPRLLAILQAPEVATWWPSPQDEEGLRDELASPSVTTLAIEVGGEVVGIIQYHEVDDPDYRSAGMDIALDPRHQGRGLGTDALRTLARYLFDARGHHRLTIDPSAANRRAIDVYRRIGFQPVGVMRRYERGPDGVWHDGLLMEMLAGELR